MVKMFFVYRLTSTLFSTASPTKELHLLKQSDLNDLVRDQNEKLRIKTMKFLLAKNTHIFLIVKKTL